MQTINAKARIEGAQSALKGEKMDANPYPETDDLHFEWLAGWADFHVANLKTSNRRNPA